MLGLSCNPPFDVSSSPNCCLQSHEILLNKSMKYWDLGLEIPGVMEFWILSTWKFNKSKILIEFWVIFLVGNIKKSIYFYFNFFWLGFPKSHRAHGLCYYYNYNTSMTLGAMRWFHKISDICFRPMLSLFLGWHFET